MDVLSIKNPFASAPVYFTAETDSTMNDACALVCQGVASGTVVVADYQRKGRGRFADRSWEARPGENLLFTLALAAEQVPEPRTQLPLVTGLAVARAVEATYELRPELKWPNDVLLDGRKLSGILCQGTGGWFLVGIGVNCNQEQFAGDVGYRATSLSRALKRPIHRFELLESVLEAIRFSLNDADWRPEAEARLVSIGKTVTVLAGGSTDARPVSGTLVGIGSGGELRLLSKGRERRIYSGELV